MDLVLPPSLVLWVAPLERYGSQAVIDTCGPIIRGAMEVSGYDLILSQPWEGLKGTRSGVSHTGGV